MIIFSRRNYIYYFNCKKEYTKNQLYLLLLYWQEHWNSWVFFLFFSCIYSDNIKLSLYKQRKIYKSFCLIYSNKNKTHEMSHSLYSGCIIYSQTDNNATKKYNEIRIYVGSYEDNAGRQKNCDTVTVSATLRENEICFLKSTWNYWKNLWPTFL